MNSGLSVFLYICESEPFRRVSNVSDSCVKEIVTYRVHSIV